MRLERIIAIILLLLVRKKVSAKYLSELFNVSLRTIYRDIEAINLAGLPLISTTGPYGGFGVEESYKVEKGIFNTEDMAVLLSALNTMQPISLGQNMHSALEKVRSLIPADELTQITSNTEQIIIVRGWLAGKSFH